MAGEQIFGTTNPEIEVRCAVHALGMRYACSASHIGELQANSDLGYSFVARVAGLCGRLASGHGLPHTPSQPKSNADYWAY